MIQTTRKTVSWLREGYWLAATSALGCSWLLSLPVPLQATTGLIATYTLLERMDIIQVSFLKDRLAREKVLTRLLHEHIVKCKALSSDLEVNTLRVGLPSIRYAEDGLLGLLYRRGWKLGPWQTTFTMEVQYVDIRFGTHGEVKAEGSYDSPSLYRYSYIEIMQKKPSPKTVVISPEALVEV